MKLYNTMSRELQEFKPLQAGQARVYCCGPTVYDYQHIGNFKTFLFEDLLVRTLRFAGYKVTHVMNITDVGHLVSDADEGEDKMLVAMRREGKSSYEIADFYTGKFFEDWDKLRLLRPDVVCKATDHIKEMIELISRLEQRGFTYLAGGNVYFDVGKLGDYGKLARLDLDKLKAGARIEVDKNKHNAQDFVLWFTKSKFENQEMQWDSPWGRGYPGWHIECSAMSIRYLGEAFDIHCGGIDHIPVHHTNEIAQSEAATGRPWVNYWMHGQFMKINDEKMSKSKGRFIVLDDLIRQGFEPLDYRFLCLNSHYRSHLNFTEEVMRNAASAWDKLAGSLLTLKDSCANESANSGRVLGEYLEQFKAAIFDDLNSPKAMAVVWAVLADNRHAAADKLATLYNFDQVLGFGFSELQRETVLLPPEIEDLLKQREGARKNKDWALADSLRKKAAALGFSIEDSAQGQKVSLLKSPA